jgi:single-strand DNA-binding protein
MATDINHVVLIGRLTRDAELSSIPNGTAVCKFSIAVNRSKKDGDSWEDEPSFFNIVLWGRQGESLHQYLLKGKQVGIIGELRQERWQQDGQNRSRVDVVADRVQLLGGKDNGDSGGNSGGGNRNGDFDNGRYNSRQNQSNGNGNPPPRSRNTTDVEDDHFADDIPF